MHWFLILSQPRGLLDEGEASETHGGRLSGHFEDDEPVMNLPGSVPVLKRK